MVWGIQKASSKFLSIMTTTNAAEYFKIKALVREIQEADAMQKKFPGKKGVDKTMALQFQHQKNTLIKELLATLIQSDFGVGVFDSFIQKMLDYLRSTSRKPAVSNDLQSSLRRLESSLR